MASPSHQGADQQPKIKRLTHLVQIPLVTNEKMEPQQVKVIVRWGNGGQAGQKAENSKGSHLQPRVFLTPSFKRWNILVLLTCGINILVQLKQQTIQLSTIFKLSSKMQNSHRGTRVRVRKRAKKGVRQGIKLGSQRGQGQGWSSVRVGKDQ